MITQELLKEKLFYDPETGFFTHRKKTIRRQAGDIAGRNVHGYWKVGINKKEYPAHRLAWLYVYGYWPNNLIDHINGNPLDNRIENLRDVTHRENNQNLSYHRDGKLWGASFHSDRGKWRARVRVDGKDIHLGYFDTELESHEVSKQYLNNLYGTQYLVSMGP